MSDTAIYNCDICGEAHESFLALKFVRADIIKLYASRNWVPPRVWQAQYARSASGPLFENPIFETHSTLGNACLDLSQTKNFKDRWRWVAPHYNDSWKLCGECLYDLEDEVRSWKECSVMEQKDWEMVHAKREKRKEEEREEQRTKAEEIAKKIAAKADKERKDSEQRDRLNAAMKERQHKRSEERKRLKQCVICGKPLGFLAKLFRRNSHIGYCHPRS